MELEILCSNLVDLYHSAMQFEFHKSTYEKYMGLLREKYADTLNAAADICASSEEGMSAIAMCIPEVVYSELSDIKNARKRDLRALDYKMTMVSYFLPVIGEIPGTYGKTLAEKTVEIWNEKLPDQKIGYSSYESIKGGFKKGIFCYITTAVCKSMNKPDGCYELETFRKYRDNYLMNADGGQELVERYYNIAPTIVKRIDRENHSEMIYREIWEKYLQPCIGLIEQEQNVECRELYTSMVKELEHKYLYS